MSIVKAVPAQNGTLRGAPPRPRQDRGMPAAYPAPGGGGDVSPHREPASGRWSIGRKLLIAFLGFFLLLAALGLLCLFLLQRVSRSTEAIAKNALPSTQLLGSIDGRTIDFQAAQYRHNLATGDTEMAVIEREMQALRRTVADQIREYEPLAVKPREQLLLGTLKQKWTAFLEDNDRAFLPLSRANRNEEAADYLNGTGKQLFDAHSEALDGLVSFNIKEAQDEAAHARDTFANSQR